jgi:small-conductance mechanosensitive channel
MQLLPLDASKYWPLLWPALAFVVATTVALGLRALLLAGLRRWPAAQSLATYTTILRGPSILWCVAFGVYVANEVATDVALLPEAWHARIALLLQTLIVLSVTAMLAGVAGRVVASFGERAAVGGAVTGLAQTTARVMVLMLGLLVGLSVVGFQITPVLTALGVGGVAVALALQDTLANLFAGVHLLADRPIRVGDYVKIGDGSEGFVTDIGWRSTRLRSLANNAVVVPNQAVSKATIVNYSQPDSRLSLGFKVSVEYSADPDQVEAALRDEVTRALGSVRGLLRDPSPGVTLNPGFGEYSLDFNVGYSVVSYVDQYAVQDELRRRILRRFRREGITMAIPARSVHVNDGSPEAWSGAGRRRDETARA